MIPLTTSHVLIEVTIPGAQSTLQDFKLPETGGGYTYDESNSWLSATSNRFIVWYVISLFFSSVFQSIINAGG